ncbi:MAG: hypothetical protein GOU98_03365 [Candidatus Altiarchaeota archaeon]|nr:hypothetical protein [Candidatus Altiarchaeota archaeon]
MKGATSTIHYVPILAITAISGILMMMLSSKLGALIANPEVFLEPAIAAAARDIALVCDGKLSKKTLGPPPPGAYYLVMNCKERQESKAVSDVILASQLYGAASSIRSGVKSFRKGADEIVRVGDDLSKVARTRGAITKTSKNTIEVTDDASKSFSKLGKRGEDALDSTSAARKRTEESAEMTQNAKSASANAATKEDQARKSAQELQKLDDMPRTNGKVVIDCSENKALCDAINYGHIQFNSAGEAIKNAARSFSDAADVGDGIADAKAASRKSVQNKVITKKSATTREVILDTRGSFMRQVVGKSSYAISATRLHLFANALKKFRRSAAPRINNMISYPGFMDINVAFLDEHSEFYDLLLGNFVGIKYTPVMVNIVNFTTDEERDELVEIYGESMNATGAATQLAFAIKDNVGSSLTTFGYYETLSYIEGSSADTVILANRNTNIDPTFYVMASTEFGMKVGPKCESESCVNYVVEVINTSFEIVLGEKTPEDLDSMILSYSESDILEENAVFSSVIDYVNQLNRLVEPVSEELTRVQLGTADWLKENCNTYTLTYGTGPIEVTTCGMVIDCMPGNFCYIGLPVINADPWIPYVPVGILDEQNVQAISKLIGLNYDSSQRIVSPGAFSGCGGTFILSGLNPVDVAGALGVNFDVPEENKAYICAMTSFAQRCRIVSCDKRVVAEPDNFVPTPIIEDRENEIFIGGNFASW